MPRLRGFGIVATVTLSLVIPTTIPSSASAHPAGTVITIAGAGAYEEGPARIAALVVPHEAVEGPDGTVYISERDAHAVKSIDPYGVIHLLAGIHESGFRGDSGPSTEAALNGPEGIAVDLLGRVLIADSLNFRVRRIDLDGTISTIAGTGTPGPLGDGGPATSASLTLPSDVAVGPNGVIYIADAGANRIRAVDADGIIRTVAGSGVPGWFGDGLPATLAGLSLPHGVAPDAVGGLYIADTENNVVRYVNSGGIMETVAGVGIPSNTPVSELSRNDTGVPARQLQLTEPSGVAVDAQGRLLIADTGSHKVRRIGLDGINTDLAGNGFRGSHGDGYSAANSGLSWPTGVVADSEGRILIADSFNNRVRRIERGIIDSIAGSIPYPAPIGDDGPATSAPPIRYPRLLSTDARGGIYIAEAFRGRVRRIDESGRITTIAGGGCRDNDQSFTGDGGPATAACLLFPYHALIAPDGMLYVSDWEAHRIRRVDHSGIITTIAGNGFGGWSGDGSPATEARLNQPYGLAMSPSGDLFVSTTGDDRVRRIDSNGIITTVAGNGAITTVNGNRIIRAGPLADGLPATQATLLGVEGIAFDATGNLYVAEWNGNSVRKIDANGIITTFAGTGAPGRTGDGGPARLASLFNPVGLSFDAAGNLYVADLQNRVVRRITRDGIIDTVAGTGVPLTSGDYGPARAAGFGYPAGVALMQDGDLIVGDYSSGRIRRIEGPVP